MAQWLAKGRGPYSHRTGIHECSIDLEFQYIWMNTGVCTKLKTFPDGQINYLIESDVVEIKGRQYDGFQKGLGTLASLEIPKRELVGMVFRDPDGFCGFHKKDY